MKPNAAPFYRDEPDTRKIKRQGLNTRVFNFPITKLLLYQFFMCLRGEDFRSSDASDPAQSHRHPDNRQRTRAFFSA
jgi:hypothetical protein